MVASDTVVGFVGAAILLVALIGVFVYESKAPAEDSLNLERKTMELAGDGSASLRGQEPAQPPIPCNPAVPQTCRAPATAIFLNLTGLPMVGQDLHFVAFLKKSDGALRLNELTQTAGKHSLSYTDSQDRTAYQQGQLVVTLELASNPDTPSNIPVYSKSLAGARTDLGVPAAPFTLATGNHTVKLQEGDSGLRVTIEFAGLANYSGYDYRVWAFKGQNATEFTFEGNVTEGAGSFDATTSFVLGGSRSDWTILVTLENEKAKTKGPMGFPLFEAKL